MNAAIMILQYEHGIINQVSDVLGAVLTKKILDENHAHLLQIQAFLWNFLDRFHHRKEERFIFPEAEKLSNRLAQDVDMLISDHDKVRASLEKMDSSLAAAGENKGWEAFCNAGDWFVRNITDHIKYEENNFFPVFEEQVPPDKRGPITRRFKEFTEKEFGGDAFYTQNERFSFKIQNEILGPDYFEKDPAP